MKRAAVVAVCLAFAVSVAAQTKSPSLPCAFDGAVLRRADGGIARFDSDSMKRRATHKTDVPDFIKQIDVKGTVVAQVLVAPSGKVICAQSLVGPPILAKPTEKALKTWTFKPEKQGGKRVAYLGILQFSMCNISCGDEGISMTLMK